MKALQTLVILGLIALFSVAGYGKTTGQNSSPTPTPTPTPINKLRVGIHEMRPCVIVTDPTDANDGISGFEIELFREAARRLKLDYEFIQVETLPKLLQGFPKQEFDVGIAGITITEEREKRDIDFSHRNLDSGLAIMILDNSGLGVLDVLRIIFSWEVALAILIFLTFIVVMGHLLYWADLGDGSISDHYSIGVKDATWMAFSLATTCGLGDITTKRTRGRIVGIFTWLGGTLVIISVFSLINSAMTAKRISNVMPEPSELRLKSVATKSNSTSVAALTKLGANITEMNTIDEAYSLLLSKKVDAVVFDAPTLLYYATNEGKGKVVVSKEMFDRQDYGFAFPEGSLQRERFNRTLLKLQESGFYRELHKKYFGE